ncbi:MAG: hypothetical protein RIM99_13490 [Cyclobacteriaceae bacterium]
MKKPRIWICLFIILAAYKIGTYFFLKELMVETSAMEIRYEKLTTKAAWLTSFEDSLMYNQEFRNRILGKITTIEELDKAIALNKIEIEKTLPELEELMHDRKQLGNSFNLYKGVNSMINFLIMGTLILACYLWIKKE